MKKQQVEQMSLSEAVNFALGKIVEQGKPCNNPNNGYCAYSDGKGNHCVVGWLLDEENDELMKWGGGIATLISDYGDDVPDLIKDNTYIFCDLQDFHDTTTPSDFEDVKKLLLTHKFVDRDLIEKWTKIKQREFDDVEG